MLRILLLGQESAGVQILNALAATPHTIVGVVTDPSTGSIGGASVYKLAREQGYRLWPAAAVKHPDFVRQLRNDSIDIVLNAHSLYKINDDLINLPSIGAFNLHPSPLPRLAGLNSVSWAIYLDENRHGATLHWMASKIDAGHIAYQHTFDITDDDTPVSLMSQCIKHGVELVQELLVTAADNPDAIPRLSQALSKR
ncbi:MAG: formyltransferase family protein, partial [Candidatus Tectomicrobia bacterium]|nr:formyltransferase family protein [Candidatus Tectomicrobia bacterium]